MSEFRFFDERQLKGKSLKIINNWPFKTILSLLSIFISSVILIAIIKIFGVDFLEGIFRVLAFYSLYFVMLLLYLSIPIGVLNTMLRGFHLYRHLNKF